MDSDAQPDLLERRRIETRNDIHVAALALFEQHGVHDTTVQQIADAAGISSRTFFRYFTSKEQAALVGQRRLEVAIEHLEIPYGSSTRDALVTVEDLAEEVIGREAAADLTTHKRVAALYSRELPLRQAAVAAERELTERLFERLTAQMPDTDSIEVRLVAELSITLWRTGWDAWGAQILEGRVVEPRDVYRRVREAAHTLAR